MRLQKEDLDKLDNYDALAEQHAELKEKLCQKEKEVEFLLQQNPDVNIEIITELYQLRVENQDLRQIVHYHFPPAMVPVKLEPPSQ